MFKSLEESFTHLYSIHLNRLDKHLYFCIRKKTKKKKKTLDSTPIQDIYLNWTWIIEHRLLAVRASVRPDPKSCNETHLERLIDWI